MKKQHVLKWVKIAWFLPFLVGLWMPTTYAKDSHESLEKRIKKLEKKQKKQEKKVKKNAKKTQKKLDDIVERVTFNGFYSFGLIKATEDVNVTTFDNFVGVDDEVCTDCLSRLGIQIDFKVSDKVNAIGQFISGNATNRELQTDWAFLRYDMTSKTSFRAGRLVTPAYAKSQYQTVGFATPWASLPTTYIKMARFFDGIDFKQQFPIGPVNSLITVMFGNTRTATATIDFSLRDMVAVSWEASHSNMSFRLAFFDYIFDVQDAGRSPDYTALVESAYAMGFEDTLVEDANTTNLIVGFEYDDGINLFLTEYSNVHWDKGSSGGYMSYYLSYGRRFGTWMPYLRYGQLEFHDSNRTDRAIATVEQTQASLGDLVTTAQGMLAQGAVSDAATQQAILVGLAEVIGPVIGQPTLDQSVTAGVIDAHDMTQIVAGVSASAADLDGLINYLGVNEGGQQTSYVFGLRKDLTSQMSVTAEYSLYTDFGNQEYPAYGEFSTKTDDDDVKVYRIVLDAVF